MYRVLGSEFELAAFVSSVCVCVCVCVCARARAHDCSFVYICLSVCMLSSSRPGPMAHMP
jgi:hypothetical protein